jgi:hypothetical protein
MARFSGGTSLLTQNRVYTGAKAEGDIPRTLGGRARWLVEFASGELQGGTTTPQSPVIRPPHSTVGGHDHSGGMMGTPIVRPLAWFTFGHDSTVVGSTLTNGNAPKAVLSTTTLTSVGRYPIFDGSLKHVWVPGCPPDSVAHRRGQIYVGMYSSVTGGASHPTVYFAVTGMDGRKITYNKALSAGANHFELDDKVSLVPGMANRIGFQCWVAAATLGAGTATASLLYVSINQVETTPLP